MENNRRSNRSNKGNHNGREKEHQQMDSPKQDIEDYSSEIVRCSCNFNDDENGFMLCCDECQTWQHGDCVGYENEDEVPEAYFCDRCRPDLYHLLPLKRKQTKKQRKYSFNDEPDEDDFSSEKTFKRLKAELEAYNSFYDKENSKKRSIKTKLGSSDGNIQENEAIDPIDKPAEAPENLQNSVRRGVSNALNNLMKEIIIQSQNEGNLTGNTLKSLDLAMKLEFALYCEYCLKSNSYKTTDQYRQKWRAITFNLKDQKNPSLRAAYLNGKISPDKLATMSSEEMASSEIKNFAQAVREASTQSSVLKTQAGPRIRYTHKGEEIIENDPSNQDQPENAQANDLKESSSSENFDSDHSEFEESNDELSYIDVSNNKLKESDTIAQKPKIIDAAIEEIDDPELNIVLEEQNDFIPKILDLELSTPPESWVGKLNMQGIGECKAVGTQIAGEHFEPEEWSSAICPSVLKVLGRSGIEESIKYLNKCVQSASRQVVVLAFRPEGILDNDDFLKIYHHFQERKRYGPLKAVKSADVKDAYVVSLEQDQSLPYYLSQLTNWRIDTVRSNRLFLGVFVISKSLKARLTSNFFQPDLGHSKSFEAKKNENSNVSQQVMPLPPAVAAAGISLEDWQKIYAGLLAHPDVANDPVKANDPQVLQSILMQIYTQHGDSL